MLTMTHPSLPTLHRNGAQRTDFRSLSLEDAPALTLDGDGYIRDCNERAEEFFKYARHELLGQRIPLLLPELGDFELMRNGQTNSRLHFLCRTGRPFAALTKDGEKIPSALYLNLLDSAGKARLTLIVRQT